MRNQVLEVGKIVNTHALRGEVKILPLVDDMKIFEQIDTLYFDMEKTKPIALTHVRYQNEVIIAELEGIDHIDKAEKLKNKVVYVEREIMGEPADGRYYICDLIGIKAYDESGEPIGQVKDVLTAGPSNVYVLAREGKKDLLIPAIPDVVKDVDIDEEKMTVHMIEGLDEL